MTTPSIDFIVGSTGAGKTTFARALAQDRRALVFSIDDWMQTLFAADLKDAPDMAAIVERTRRARLQMWEVGAQALALGVSVVFDSGLLTVADRASERAKAQSLGIRPRTHWIDTPAATRWSRVSARNASRDGGYRFEVTRPMFDFIEHIWQAPTPKEIDDSSFIVVSNATA
jgi:predicted kinase